jgi:multidrug efflux pump subunit AcrB
VSALVLVFGLKALGSLPVNQYPQTQNAIVTITTAYYGADPQTIAGFITQPLEASVAQAQGIDYLSSTSVSGISTIFLIMRSLIICCGLLSLSWTRLKVYRTLKLLVVGNLLYALG